MGVAVKPGWVFASASGERITSQGAEIAISPADGSGCALVAVGVGVGEAVVVEAVGELVAWSIGFSVAQPLIAMDVPTRAAIKAVMRKTFEHEAKSTTIPE